MPLSKRYEKDKFCVKIYDYLKLSEISTRLRISVEIQRTAIELIWKPLSIKFKDTDFTNIRNRQLIGIAVSTRMTELGFIKSTKKKIPEKLNIPFSIFQAFSEYKVNPSEIL